MINIFTKSKLFYLNSKIKYNTDFVHNIFYKSVFNQLKLFFINDLNNLKTNNSQRLKPLFSNSKIKSIPQLVFQKQLNKFVLKTSQNNKFFYLKNLFKLMMELNIYKNIENPSFNNFLKKLKFKHQFFLILLKNKKII